MGGSANSTVETNPTPDPAAGIWERLDHLLDAETLTPETPSPETPAAIAASKLVQFPNPRPEPPALPPAPHPHPVNLPALDATLEALVKLIAPEHSQGETLGALQQVVTVLNAEAGAALATQADVARLTADYEDLQGQVAALQTPAPSLTPLVASPGPTDSPTVPPMERATPPQPEPEMAPPALAIPSAIPDPDPPTVIVTATPDPLELTPNLEALTACEANRETPETAPAPPRRRFALTRRQGIGLLAIALTLGALVGYVQWIRPQRHLITQLESALAADPNLSLYRILPEVQGRRVILRGTVPHRELRQEIQTLINGLAPNYQIEDQLIVVDGPVIAAVNRLAATFNSLPGTLLTAQFHGGQVILTGTTAAIETEAMIVQRFEAIPGVMAVENFLRVQPLSLPTRFYFGHNKATVEPVDIKAKVIPVKNFLQQYPHLRVEIRGYSHGSEEGGDRLALQRAGAVQTLLEDYGIDRRRLAVVRTGGSPANVTPDQDRWLHRTVAFNLLSDRPSGQH